MQDIFWISERYSLLGAATPHKAAVRKSPFRSKGILLHKSSIINFNDSMEYYFIYLYCVFVNIYLYTLYICLCVCVSPKTLKKLSTDLDEIWCVATKSGPISNKWILCRFSWKICVYWSYVKEQMGEIWFWSWIWVWISFKQGNITQIPTEYLF